MAAQYASVERKTAALSSEFGRKVAEEKFGAELIASFPVFSRGPRKGMLKGFLCWTKCTVGGWTHDMPDNPGKAGVVRPGTSHWRVAVASPDTDPCGHSIVARWTWDSCSSQIVENLQTPQAAEALHKAYGSNKRYA